MKIKKLISLLLAAMLIVTSNGNCSAMISDSDSGHTGSPSDVVIPKLTPYNRSSVEEIKQIARDFEQFPERLKASDDVIAAVDAACDRYDSELDAAQKELQRYRNGTNPSQPRPVFQDKRFYEGTAAGGILVAAIATVGISVYARITNAHSHNK